VLVRGSAHRLTRRALLGGAGAAYATLAAGPLSAAPIDAAPARGARAARGMRIGIVGAGIAGLCAARVLADHGVAATIFEAKPKAGGRIHSETQFWGGGQVSEYCAELIDTSHVTMRALAKRYGLQLSDVLLAQAPGSEETIFFGEGYYPAAELFEAFRPVYRTLSAQVEACGPATTYLRSTAAGRTFDKMSLNAWIERYVPGGSSSDVGRYILQQYVAEYGIDPGKQSSLNMIYWLGRQPDYDDKTGEFNALGPSDERFHIAGGNGQLPAALAQSLGAERFRFRYVLLALARRSDGRIDLTFDTPGGTRVETVDKAIVTIPFIVLRGVDLRRAGFDARKLAAIDELAYGDHSKLAVQTTDRWWSGTGPWPGRSDGSITTDRGFQQAWDGSRAQPGPHGLVIDYAAAGQSDRLRPSAPYTTSDSAQTAAYARDFVAALERVWPGANERYTGKAVLSHCTYDPYVRGSYSGWLTGQYERFAGYERVRQGNVLFAGEHCSVLLQGFMEGAAREGVRAASEVLHDASLRPGISG
jgi:monoamine oxidase